ncbi:hypothetical protein BGZ61DRAFT_49642 [Ilyonectria robusta]|uniref:uncharacterized protein n=1 Tax=Ilyonectria robusta TaxID=1079257 RepID=UPI001E8E5366|nr:uncharacterized protein BGZ61DRAFT_49642 [Ilyonectria robusta]KAH8686998.1 hypothetical protein BGZ61DRAFT_49642 [Ilyonectria robusta]
MIPLHQSAQTLGVLFLLVASWSPVTTAIDVDICASLNTGSTDRNTSIYQTNGLCYNFCVNDYAYAITQSNSCWCSNFAPAKSTQEDVSKCNTPCPAYPIEDCGGDGLFGYLSLGGVLPSGTQAASSSATSESDDTSSKTSASTESTSEVQTVTDGGTIKTVTIGPSHTGSTSSDSDTSGLKAKNSGLKTGEVVGIVVGVIGAVIVAAGLALFFWFRRRKQRQRREGFEDDPSIRDSSSGNQPDMSVAGASPVSPNAASKRNSTLQVDPRMDPFKQGLYVRGGSHESVNTLGDEHDYSRRIQAPKVLRATNPDPA